MPTFNNSKTFNHNKSKRFLGVEIEVAYSDPDKYAILNNTALKWHGDIGHDGSIDSKYPTKSFLEKTKTEGNSYEIRTAPTNGDLFIKQIMEYGYALNASNTFANESCGLHVHIDARDLKPADLDRVLMLWSKVESSMFKLVHPGRGETNWCHAWEFSSDIKKIEEKINYEGGGDGCGECHNCVYGYGDDPCTRPSRKRKNRILNKIKSGDCDLDRYKSLNLCSLEDLGTLENRMHHGTTNPDTIINWALINASLVDFAKKNTMQYIESMPRGFEALFATISSDRVLQWVETRRNAWKKDPISTLYQDQVDDRKWRHG